MNWRHLFDRTQPVITAERHMRSSHGEYAAGSLPKNCLLFEMGGALGHIERKYATTVLLEKIPCFLYSRKCMAVDGVEDACVEFMRATRNR